MQTGRAIPDNSTFASHSWRFHTACSFGSSSTKASTGPWWQSCLPHKQPVFGQPVCLRRHADRSRAVNRCSATQTPKPSFVEVFRGSAQYVKSHRKKTVVVCLSSEVMANKKLLDSVLSDIIILHRLSMHLVLVLGVRKQMDQLLLDRGIVPRFAAGFRVSDGDVMTAAAEATGAARTEVEAALSKALSTQVLRRHSRSFGTTRQGPSCEVVYGNWINGKRRGVVDDVDCLSSGSVRSLNTTSINGQLRSGNIVLLTCLAYSLAGKVLNCNVYDIATHAAVELEADKLIVMTTENLQARGIPPWLPLSDARRMLSPGADVTRLAPFYDNPPASLAAVAPTCLVAATRACHHGVNRSHVIHAAVPGALLVELFSRDGLGVMISGDVFEGIRAAAAGDSDSIRRMYRGLQLEGGAPLPRGCLTEDAFEKGRVFVIERENQVLGCAVVSFLGLTHDGVSCAELTAFCVHPLYRGAGRTDSLLDYVEQWVREAGVRRLLCITGPHLAFSIDFFVLQSFRNVGPAIDRASLLPKSRWKKLNRNGAVLLLKEIYAPDATSTKTPVGKRIGI